MGDVSGQVIFFHLPFHMASAISGVEQADIVTLGEHWTMAFLKRFGRFFDRNGWIWGSKTFWPIKVPACNAKGPKVLFDVVWMGLWYDLKVL